MSHDDTFKLFRSMMAIRWEQGREEYGDKSFSKAPDELMREIGEELVDVANWAAILYCRVQQMRSAMSALAGVERALCNREQLIRELADHYSRFVQDLKESGDGEA